MQAHRQLQVVVKSQRESFVRVLETEVKARREVRVPRLQTWKRKELGRLVPKSKRKDKLYVRKSS